MLAEYLVSILDATGKPGEPFELQTEAGTPAMGSWLCWRGALYQIVDVVNNPDKDARTSPQVTVPTVFCRRGAPPQHVLDLYGLSPSSGPENGKLLKLPFEHSPSLRTVEDHPVADVGDPVPAVEDRPVKAVPDPHAATTAERSITGL